MDFDQAEPALRQRTSFDDWASDRLRLSDTDLLGHINNTAYAVFCETGRVAFNTRHVAPYLAASSGVLVARVAINYRAETFFPGDVDIGTCLLRIGRTSLTIGQGLFFGEQTIATAEGVLVHINAARRTPAPWPDAVLAALSPLLAASHRRLGLRDPRAGT